MPPKVISGGDNPYDIHDAKLSSSATAHESSSVTAHEISNRQCLMQAVKALIFLMIEHNKNENRNVLDVRASLKAGLQIGSGYFCY